VLAGMAGRRAAGMGQRGNSFGLSQQPFTHEVIFLLDPPWATKYIGPRESAE
jgi:hypothetical protein